MTAIDTALSGSPRQVSWARDIRARAVEALADPPAELPATDEERAQTLELLASVTTAKWWIETRSVDGWRWPAMLGVSRPAAPQVIDDLGRPSVGDPVSRAAQVRQDLDAADIPRIVYGLWVAPHLLEIQLLGAVPGGPDLEQRRDLARRVWQALAGGAWVLHYGGLMRSLSESAAVGSLANGDLVRIEVTS